MTVKPTSSGQVGTCPECFSVVEIRIVEPSIQGWTPMFQVRVGPDHERRCKHWREETPHD